MKKIINDPQTVVAEMCRGIVAAHPDLCFDQKHKIISKRKLNPDKVTLISGGGSGHEPAHAGYIGDGMLDAAVCGDIFASPSQIQVYQAIRETTGNGGCLLIVKNYSGDILNFTNALYLAEEDGLSVDYVKVDDDIAVQDSLYTVGQRGVAGTILVHKAAGAAAASGMDLKGVKAAAELAIANVRSIGFALSSCTVPVKGTPTFKLGDAEIEYGIGIHGEPGIRREPSASADELAERMTAALAKELKLITGDELTLVVNGFGGTPLMELYLFHNAVSGALASRGIRTYRTFVGNFMTSIDMQGASLSFMKMTPQLKALIDYPSDTPALKVSGPVDYIPYINIDTLSGEDNLSCDFGNVDESGAIIKNNCLSLKNVMYITFIMSESIINNEVPFCELDSHAGDGDFGTSIAKGFRQLRCEWQAIERTEDTIGGFLGACALVIMEHCGGASGPIWGAAFRAAGKSAGSKTSLTTVDFAELMQAAVLGVQRIGERAFGRGAVIGDKTLIDALIPCTDVWMQCAKTDEAIKSIFRKGAQAAADGAKKTEELVARMGRSGTVGERSLGYPDAGAHALGVIFHDIAYALK